MTDLDFVGALHRALDAAPPYALPTVLSAVLSESVGAKEVALWLADYGEVTLERVTADLDPDAKPSLPVDDSAAGRAFLTQAPVVVDDDNGERLYLPVAVRAERVGVLELLLPDSSARVREELVRAAMVVGYVVSTARRYTDLFERVRRRRELILAAEIQWELLPVLAYEADELSVAGALEPAHAIAGDSFDYAVEADDVHVAITDGMGHGLRAALLGTLAVAALRHARRRGHNVLYQVKEASQVVHDQFGGDQFVTGTIGTIDMSSGVMRVVNAGHPRPWLAHGDVVEEVELFADYPLGLFPGIDYREQEIALEPGDRVLFVSDGVMEATSPAGEEFGSERLRALIAETRDQLPTEVVRRIARAVVDHCQVPLRDDATVVSVDWRPRLRRR
ncbi:MAG: serine/threonine-protein phosphatase [Acidimicrobiia bacterium]|nr:serine/threonine-protein phosphatase [Acidimicrobiia bacterium]